jgi:hypothetical protein
MTLVFSHPCCSVVTIHCSPQLLIMNEAQLRAVDAIRATQMGGRA